MSAQNEIFQGSYFSSNELKKRLIKMQIPFDQSIKDKKYPINKYNEAIKDENNLKLILDEITTNNCMKVDNLKRRFDKSDYQNINNSILQNSQNENENKLLFNPINNIQHDSNTSQNSPLSSENKVKNSKKLQKKSTIRIDNLTEIKLLKEPSEFNLNFSSEKNLNENGTDFKQYAQSSKINRVYNEGNIRKSIINLKPIHIRDSIEYNHQKINQNLVQLNNQNNKNNYLRRRTINNPLNLQNNIPNINNNFEKQRLSVPNNNFINKINNQNYSQNNNNIPKIKEYIIKKENDIYSVQNKFQNIQNNINNTHIDNINVKFEEPKIEKKSQSQSSNNFRRMTISSPFEIKSQTEVENNENNLQNLNQTYQTLPNKLNKKKVQFCDEYFNKTFNNIIDIKKNQTQRKSNLIKHRNSVDNSNLYYNKTNDFTNEFNLIPNNNYLKDKNIKNNNFQIYESLINNSRKKKDNLNNKINIDDNSTTNSSSNHSSNQNNNRIMKNIPSNLPLSPIKEINSQKKDNSSLNIENYNHNENNKDGYFNIIQNIKNGLKSKVKNNINYSINNNDNNTISFGNDSYENNNISIPLKQSINFDKMNNNNLYNDIEKEGLSPINKNYNNTTFNYDNYNFNKDFIQTQNQLNKPEPIYDEIDTSSNQNNFNIYNMKNNINSQNEKEFKWGELISNSNNDDNNYLNNLKFQNQNDYNSKFNYEKRINPRYNEPQSIHNNGQFRLLLNKEEQNINYDLIYSLLAGGFSIGAISLVYYYCLKNKFLFNTNEHVISNNESTFNNFIKFIFSPFEITNLRKYIFESLIILIKKIGNFLFWDYLNFTFGIFIFCSISFTLYKNYKEKVLIEKIFNEIKNELKRLYDNSKSNEDIENYFEIGISENEIIKKYHHEFNLSQEQFLKRILPKLRAKRKNDYNIKNFENIINGRKQIIWQWNPY